jgi:PAS domain S-box-containing protein
MTTRFSLQSLTNPWTNLSVRRQGFIVVAVPVLCLIGSLAAFSWLRASIDRSQQWVDHTSQVLLETNHLLTELLNSETAVRGYALTRRPEFLEPYYQAQVSLPSRLSRLKQLLRDNAQQERRMQEIQNMTQARVAILINLIDQVNQDSSNALRKDAIKPLVLQGKDEMDRLRLSLAQFEQEEQRLLRHRQTELSEQRNAFEFALWVAAGISALGSALALGLFRRLDQNLSEREQRLLESRSLLDAIVSNVVDGVVILDQTGRIESINTAAVSMFGYTLPQATGQGLSLLLNPPLTADSGSKDSIDAEYWVKHLLSCEQQWQAIGRRSSGDSFPVEISISQIPVDQRMIVIIRDVTAQQQAAAKLQSRADELTQLNDTLASTNAELRSRNQDLDQFAYVASHDLKAPLRAIASLSEWIEEDLAEQIPEENRQQIYLLRSRVYRMEALINGILDYSRIGKRQVPIETVDVRVLLEEIIDTLAPPPTFIIEIGLEMPIIKTRRLLLQRVLTNLLDNAHKHHPRNDGNVTVSVTDQGRWYEFAIQDDGNGIDPLYHDKIFTIFQTLQSRDTQENTGVGLSIIKKILETEGGSIRVESTEGEGATFRFTWLKSPLHFVNVSKPIALEGSAVQ